MLPISLLNTKKEILLLFLVIEIRNPINQGTNPARKIWHNNTTKEIEKGLDRNQKPSWDNIGERVAQFLQNYQPGGKNLV
jgi:hypothetical protein